MPEPTHEHDQVATIGEVRVAVANLGDRLLRDLPKKFVAAEVREVVRGIAAHLDREPKSDPLRNIANQLNVIRAQITELQEMASAPKRRLVSTSEAAEYLGIGERTLKEMMSRGDMPSVKVSSARRLDIHDLDAYIIEQKTAQITPDWLLRGR